MDTGQWWFDQTGLPLPLGANGIRKDLGPHVTADVQRLLRASIEYGLQHRREALEYALGFGRGLDPAKADEFVGMYVNDWTLDFGPRGPPGGGGATCPRACGGRNSQAGDAGICAIGSVGRKQAPARYTSRGLK